MLLVADKIKKNYSRKGHREDELDAVKETTFEVDEGEFIAIVGRSGGGKSTFLSMLSGLLKPTDGKVLFQMINSANFGIKISVLCHRII